MVSNLTSGWRSFWHTMTSNDRHADHNSPYRTGQHVPLGQSRHAPLTAVTSAHDSRPDLTSPYPDDPQDPKLSPPPGISTPPRPYSPGLRSITSKGRLSSDSKGKDANVTETEIQMQSFTDGQPPPPPIAHSWAKIDRWLEDHFQELYDNLCEGATGNDVNELEHMLDCTLPTDVRESLQIHDGQERPGLPTGVIFGCMLLDCEEIVQEWNNWRRVNEEFLATTAMTPHSLRAFGNTPTPQSSTHAGPSSGPSTPTLQATGPNSLWRQQLLDKQDSHPPRAVQKAYAHPSWIPLARDWGGNNIAVDLAPGVAGKWGQVIIFGRDFDCKYVVARSWAAFLAMLADDYQSPHVVVEEDTGELKLKPFKRQNVEPPYLQILRWRTDQKYGRRPPPPALNRRSTAGLGISNMQPPLSSSAKAKAKAPQRNTLISTSPYATPIPESVTAPPLSAAAISPLAAPPTSNPAGVGSSSSSSPTRTPEERGRSLSRFPARGASGSPFGIASPLARVQEQEEGGSGGVGNGIGSGSSVSPSPRGVAKHGYADSGSSGASGSSKETTVDAAVAEESFTGLGVKRDGKEGAQLLDVSSPVPTPGVGNGSAVDVTVGGDEEGETETEGKVEREGEAVPAKAKAGLDHEVIEKMDKVEI